MAKASLSQPIYARLSERILRWDYLPGHRFTEEGLCREFCVSRSPVREALNTLAENGLIEKKPGHGYSVKLLNFVEINELYDVRLALETSVVERLCRTGIDEQHLEELRAFWSDIQSRLPEAAKTVAAADEEFHETLARLCGNKILASTLKSVDRRIHFVRLADITTEDRVRATCREHLELLDAIRDGDEARARDVLRKNIDGGRSSVERAIKDALAHAYHTGE
ncbi:MAG: GntR family transcriptional regulator [Spirochaetia bacterium]